MQNNIIKQRNEKLAQKVITELQKRHFDAYFCSNKDEVIQKLNELISKEDTISSGGSTTLSELGIPDYLTNKGYKFLSRENGKTIEEKAEIARKAMTCDVFLMSSNAISEDGQIVNIDGLGNRVAALIYGPKNVIIIAGMNKISKTLEDAYNRARNTAAPINLQRIAALFGNTETPCLHTGSCADCKSESSICAQIVTTRLCRPKGRIKVILVNEELGY